MDEPSKCPSSVALIPAARLLKILELLMLLQCIKPMPIPMPGPVLVLALIPVVLWDVPRVSWNIAFRLMDVPSCRRYAVTYLKGGGIR